MLSRMFYEKWVNFPCFHLMYVEHVQVLCNSVYNILITLTNFITLDISFHLEIRDISPGVRNAAHGVKRRQYVVIRILCF